jgi:hypothetical protein
LIERRQPAARAFGAADRFFDDGRACKMRAAKLSRQGRRVLGGRQTIEAALLATSVASRPVGNPEQFDFVSRRVSKRPLAIDRKYMGETDRGPRFNGLVLQTKLSLRAG